MEDRAYTLFISCYYFFQYSIFNELRFSCSINVIRNAVQVISLHQWKRTQHIHGDRDSNPEQRDRGTKALPPQPSRLHGGWLGVATGGPYLILITLYNGLIFYAGLIVTDYSKA